MTEDAGNAGTGKAAEPRVWTPESRPQPTRGEVSPPASAPAIPVEGGDKLSVEVGGPSGPEPTRYGDWEKNGRCIDF
ncbi:MAG: DUF1674 domain-containing protein [Gammaproteobacteria bacterium]|nr:DUF1674 domain-containing protein [Gammaproteobacteria bacterium]